MVNQKRAIALFSGGLDSILAIKLIMNQGIEVIGVNFRTPFFGFENIPRNMNLDIKVKIIDISLEYLKILENPKHGYGKNINPCIDCHAFMFKKAGDLMNELHASFIISGEVLGERPMSQNRNSLKLIEKMSGYSGWILRPLSALLLPETIPEKTGFVNRSKLLNISGRSRKRQIELASEMGIENYPSPAGGCKLTEPGFTNRFKDLLIHQKYCLDDIELLKVGRHFRLNWNTKLIVGRNMTENKQIEGFFRNRDVLLKASKVKGPTSLLKASDNLNEELVMNACRIASRYCDKEFHDEIEIACYYNGKQDNPLFKKVKAYENKEIDCFRI